MVIKTTTIAVMIHFYHLEIFFGNIFDQNKKKKNLLIKFFPYDISLNELLACFYQF